MALSRGKGEQEDITRLTSWFTDNGGTIDGKVTLARDSTNGVSVYAKEDIPNPPSGGYKVCVCPPNLHLSHLQAPPELRDQLSEHVLAYVALVKEVLLGEKSFWAPYIKCLPSVEQMTTPIFFHEEMTQEAIDEKSNDTAWLLGTNLDKAWRARAQQWKEDWENACSVMKKQGIRVEGYTWDLYKWAATIYTSRSFISDPGANAENEIYAILLPFVDMLNHRFPAKVHWFYDHGAFALSIAEPLVAGQEIFNNYGGKGNEELLNGYGFTIPSNPCDTVALRFGTLPTPVVAEVRTQLPSWDSTRAVYLRPRRHYDGLYAVVLPSHPTHTTSGIPQPLWTVMHALRRVRDKPQAHTREAWRTRYAANADLLELLATKYDDMDQYADFLPSAPANQKQAFAQVYREGQMRILRETVKEVESLVLGSHVVDVERAIMVLDEERAAVCREVWDGEADVEVFGELEKMQAIVSEENLEAEAWVMWLCAGWAVWTQAQAERKPLHNPRLARWLASILASYPFQASPTYTPGQDPITDPPTQAALTQWATVVVAAEARMLAYVDSNRWSGTLVMAMEEPKPGR